MTNLLLRLSVVKCGLKTSLLRISTAKAVYNSEPWYRTPVMNPRAVVLSLARKTISEASKSRTNWSDAGINTVCMDTIRVVDRKIIALNSFMHSWLVASGVDRNSPKEFRLASVHQSK